MESELSKLTLQVEEVIRIKASIETSFETLIEQMGQSNEGINGTPMPMRLETFPGGRWFRDLDHDNGHCWGTVQAIRHPDLLEISGPLFMSYPVVNNLQYRLVVDGDDTLLTLRHTAFGLIPEDHRAGLGRGWHALLERIRDRATPH
ncbi:MAG: SRPBCC domain-containing protein [Thermoanaerobaculia bacterium]|nr:SRPBCC domain-containing protein [Thermoanaerobaculia bacterium]